MPGPTVNFNTVEVRGRYVGIDGTAPQGQVTFSLDSQRLVDAEAETTIVNMPITVELIDGAFIAQIPATDDPDITPEGFTWLVKEEFPGGSSYHIQVPLSAAGTGLEISNIVPTTLSPGDPVNNDILRVEFDNLAAQVQDNTNDIAALQALGSGDVTEAELAAGLATKADTTALTAHTTNTNNPHATTAAQVGLGNVDNTSDSGKPVSLAQQAALDLKANQSALDLKAPKNSPTFTGTVSGITKAMVGLANVDNTTDVAKPISTTTQAALDFLQDQIDGLSSGASASIRGYYFPEDFGAVGDGVADDTVEVQAAIDAAYAEGGGIVVLSGLYGFSGDILQKNGVTVMGVGITGPAASLCGLKAIGISARYRWGKLDGPGAHPYPGPLMYLNIDGAGIAGATTELLRCECVETSAYDVHVMNSAGNGVDMASSQNVNFYNPNFGSCPNGAALVLRAKNAGAQPPGHCIFNGGHIGDSQTTIWVTSHDASFFVGPHDNYFMNTIVETGRNANSINCIGMIEDGDTHFDGCVFTIGAQVTAITENAGFVVKNAIRTTNSTTMTMRNCSIGTGAGTVKAAHGIRVVGAAGRVSNNIYYAGQTRVANCTYMHCHDGADALVSIDGNVVFVVNVTDQFTSINGGTLTGLLRNTQVPTRYTVLSTTGNPLQIRRSGDANNRFQLSRDGTQSWLDGAAGTIRAAITRQTSNLMTLGGTWQAANGWSRALTTQTLAADAAVTVDVALVSVQVLNFTATGADATSVTITNGYDGAELRFIILGTGVNVITWPGTGAGGIQPSGTQSMPQPVTGKVVVIDLIFVTNKWWEVSRSA